MDFWKWLGERFSDFVATAPTGLLIFTFISIPIALCALPFLFGLLRRRRKRRLWDIYGVKTIGVVRSAKHTTVTINDNPEMDIELDAIAEDGSTFPVKILLALPRAYIDSCDPGSILSIRYDSRNPARALADLSPDEDIISERVARYQCFKHPGEMSYERRINLAFKSVVKKARLESLRLTGREEAGDVEAEAVVRVVDSRSDGMVLSRVMFLTDKMLRHMVPGKYIDISIVPGDESYFGVVTDLATKLSIYRGGDS